jgi:hypothetical protein
MNKIDTYILLIIIAGVIGASALIYYMSPPLIIAGGANIRELTVTQMEFTTLNDSDIIILHVISTSMQRPVILAAVKINGDTQNKITIDSIHGLTFEPGDSGTITIEHDWTTGNDYTVDLFTSDGTLVGYHTDTA